ncbi:hypothetical protein NEMIN01_2094 [Nematocida minor]|uniref:uncharacterized protein n=1 Tax=Nematocida minor TaxID=1912983 RepID=UPI00221F07D4|nr:uncharacterized protein NEMIN01_2094 [Nematocida minor]KAI5192581.1 hypothetical protein NEMIN01_2094 [Nematocida minor]
MVVLVVICAGFWIKREYGKDKTGGTPKETFNDSAMIEKEKKVLSLASAENSPVDHKQMVSDCLCKIVDRYGNSFKLLGADSNGLFTKDNALVKLFTDYLYVNVLAFKGNRIELSTVLDSLVAPVKNRRRYEYRTVKDDSVQIAVSPELVGSSDDLLNILLTFVDLQYGSANILSIYNASLSENFVLSKFNCLADLEQMLLLCTSIHSNAFKDIENLKTLKNLVMADKTVLLGDGNVKISIPNLKYLLIEKLEEKQVERFLCSTDAKYSSFDLKIRMVSLSNAQIISSLSYISSLNSFELNGVVFKEVPDFTFIKKSKNLENLKILDVFYGYDEKYSEDSLPKIRKNVDYLNVSQVSHKYETYSEKVKKIIEENRTVGEEIAPSSIDVNNSIYHDLGLSKVKGRHFSCMNITISLLKDNSFSDVVSYRLYFHVDMTLNAYSLSIFTKSNKPDTIFHAHKTHVVLPYSSCKNFERLYLQFYHENEITEPFVNFFVKMLFLYTHPSDIKEVFFTSEVVAPININTVFEISRYFKNIKEVQLENYKLLQTRSKAVSRINNIPDYDIYTDDDRKLTNIVFARNT